MKHRIGRRLVAALLAALLVCLLGAALADVKSVEGSSYIRSEPSLWGEVLGSLPKGASAQHLDTAWDERDVPWYKVSYRGTCGWVSSMYTSLNGNHTYHQLNGDVVASGGATNIRAGHYRSADSLGTLPKGKSAKYLDWSATDERGVLWYYVTYGSTTGWVSSRYTTLKGGSGDEDSGGWMPSYGWVTGASGDSNIRKSPSLGSAALGTLPKGSSAEYLGDTSYDNRGVAWYRVRYRGVTGWVSSRYTRLEY